MKTRSVFAGLAVLAAAGAAAAATTVAPRAESDDAALLAAARLSMTQAVGQAEARTRGRAIEAALEGTAAAPEWRITVLTGADEAWISVDARTGATSVIDDPEADEHDGAVTDDHADGETDDD
nr:PepSY domain-containing protein [uncultured Brevundimonas sp.]